MDNDIKQQKIPLVDLNIQYQMIKDDIDSAIKAVIEESAFVRGRFVQEFEGQFAKKLKISHCIGVGNGTDAMYIALHQLGIGPGDEVITTAHSWISTAETISQTGATPVFVDIDPEYHTIDPNLIEEKISKNTKAIIPVHLYGMPVDMDPICDVCQDRSLYLIEDCAQAHFAQYNEKYVGTFGDVATFSFYPGKNLGAYGDAGAIVTENKNLAVKMRRYANHGALLKHDHQFPGVNSRLDGLQAAILSTKLPHIDQWNGDRMIIADRYSSALNKYDNIEIPKVRQNSTHVFHIYAVRTQNRDKMGMFLKNLGIDTAVHYPVPLPYLDAYKSLGYQYTDFPHALSSSRELLSLPIYPYLSEKKLHYIIEGIRNFQNQI